MGQIFVEGLPFSIEIEGDAPTKDEAQRIMKLVERLGELDKGPMSQTIESLQDSPVGSLYTEGALDKLGKFEDQEKKQIAIDLLDDLGFVDKKEMTPLEQIGIDRTTAGITGSMLLSAPGFKEMFNLKNQENMKKLYKGVKLFDPKQLAIAGAKTFFGGVFGEIGGRAAYDIANFVLTGDPDMLKFLKTIDADTKEAIFYEALGLGLPTVLGSGFRLLTDLKDPAVQNAYRAAERLGIQLNFGQIAKYAGAAKALGPLPFIGSKVRKTIATQVGTINEKFQKLVELYAPITTFTKGGTDIFATVDKRFDKMNKIMSRLWDKAYDAHAMLIDKNVFRADDLNKFFTNLVDGKVLRQFRNLPTNENGIIESYETILKSGFFENSGLSRIEGKGLKDLIETMRRYQIEVQKNGGKVSYDTIRNFNEDISGLFKDLTEGDKPFKNQFALLLSQFRGANDDILLNINETLIKDGISDNLLPNILRAHDNANTFTAALKALYEGPTGTIFGKYEKNLFKPGFITSKKARDQILGDLLKIKSPEMLKELKTIIGPEQFKVYINEYLSAAFAKAASDKSADFIGRTRQLDFDPKKLNEALGFDIRQKSDFTEELFRIAGVNKDLIKDLITTGAFIEGLKIGNPSAFLQRRFQLNGTQNFFGSILAGGAAMKGGEIAFSEDDGIFTKGVKGLIGLWAIRYGVGKVFANPKLASKIADVYNPEVTLKFNTKIDIIRELFNIHHNESPESISETASMFEGVYNDMKEVLKDAEIEQVEDLLNELKTKENIFTKSQEMEEFEEEEQKLREDIPDEDETSSINIPSPDQNINMAQVVSPIEDPSIINADMPVDASIMAKLEGVGLPLFANKGGIASLVNTSKPKQMVA